MVEVFSTDVDRENGYSLSDDGEIVTIAHPDFRAPLYLPWGSIAHAWGPLPDEEAKPVPPALGEVLARRGADEPPPVAVVDPAARAARVDGIPAALQPQSDAVPNFISAERAAAMTPDQLEALKTDGVQILPPASANVTATATRGDYPGKKKP